MKLGLAPGCGEPLETVADLERYELELTKTLAHVAQALGSGLIHTTCFTVPNEPVLERIELIAEVAADAGVRLALEFVPGVAIDSIPKAVDLINRVGTDRMALMLDSWHFFRGTSTWADLETIDPDELVVVQFNDAPPAISEDIMSESTNRRTWPGRGEFELTRFADTLTNRGWDGVVAVEVLAEDIRQLDAETYIRTAAETALPYWPAPS